MGNNEFINETIKLFDAADNEVACGNIQNWSQSLFAFSEDTERFKKSHIDEGCYFWFEAKVVLKGIAVKQLKFCKISIGTNATKWVIDPQNTTVKNNLITFDSGVIKYE